eukprot:179730_1
MANTYSPVVLTIAILIPLVAPNSLFILNAGFEADWYPIPLNTYYYTSPAPHGWTRYNPADVAAFAYTTDMGVANPSGGHSIADDAFGDAAPEGHQVAFIDQWIVGIRDKGELGIYQMLTETVTESTTYSLSVWLANPASSNWSNSSDDGGAFYDYTGFPGYKIELIASDPDVGDAIVLAQDDDTLSPFDEGEWKESVIEVHVSPGDSNIGKRLGIRLINKNIDNGMVYGMDVFYDDVRLQAKTETDNDDDQKKDGGAKKEDSTGVIVVVVLLILLCVVGVLVFVWWKKKKENKPTVVLGDADDDRKQREAEDNALVTA